MDQSVNSNVNANLDDNLAAPPADSSGEATTRLTFANKAAVTVNAAGGDDFIFLNSVNAAGLTALTIDGGAGTNVFASTIVSVATSVTTLNMARQDTDVASIQVDLMYEYRLHRPAEAAGLAFWRNMLNTAGIAAVAAGIERSPEARTDLVQRWY